MAALALVTAACNDDNGYAPEQPAQESRLVEFTATIILDDDDAATTRALSGPDGDNNINAEWAMGEHVALVYKKGSNSHDYVVKVADATVTAKSNKTATINARLDLTENEANRNSDITLIYPYSAVIASGEGIGQVRSELWANQTGTVADISQYRDLRSGSGTMTFMTTPNGSSIKLGSSVTMSPQAAIWKLTLSQAIDATCPLSITDADNDVLLTTVTPASETNEVYVALPSTDAKKSYKFSVTKNGFEYSKTGKAQLEAGRYYQTSLTLAADIKTLSQVTSEHIGRIVGDDGKVYPSVAALPSGVTAVAMISYLKEGYDGFGLAIELNSNPAKGVWQVAKDKAESNTAVAGGTWRLPSKDDWNDMVAGCGGAAGFISKYNATGVTFDTSKNYWTSNHDASTGRFYYTRYFANELSFYTDDGSNKNNYLAVLVFGINSTQPDYGIPLTEVTSKHIGRIVGSDGKAHDPNYRLPTGVTPVAMICYVKTGGGGWAIELNENPSNGKQREAKKMEDKPVVPINNMTTCKWSLPTKAQWCKMIAVCAGRNPDVDYESVNSSSCKTFIAQYNATGVYFKKDTPLWTSDVDRLEGTYIKITSSGGAEFGTTANIDVLNYLGMLEF